MKASEVTSPFNSTEVPVFRPAGGIATLKSMSSENGAIGKKGADQQPQQAAGDTSARPAISIQHSMIVGETGLLIETHDTESGRPGLSMAPATNTSTCRHVGNVKLDTT